MSKQYFAGSNREPLPGASIAGPADADARLEVTLLLRRNAIAGLQERVERIAQGDYSLAPLSREAFLKEHGASNSDIEIVSNFAAANDLSVVDESRARRSVVLSGTVRNFENAFGVKLQQYRHPGGTYRGREGHIYVPDALQDVVEAVMGLDNRPQARAHFRRMPAIAHDADPHDGVQSPAAEAASFPLSRIASLYGFPAATGKGQTIAIVEFGGGSRSADLQQYFGTLGLKQPKLISVSVDHGHNHATGDAEGPDGEVMLDIEIAGAIAQEATLVVYYAPNTDAGFLSAVSTAIHDDNHRPSVLSISWGSPEASWTEQAMTALDQAFQDAVAMGITVCVAAGDGGSTDGLTGNENHVDFPASSPNVLACGGTSLVAQDNRIKSETVWNGLPKGGATGGGISRFFPLPSWQAGRAAKFSSGAVERLAMRGVPDVAGNADPQTGYAVRVDGQNLVYGGTSAVAPLWAAFVAQINGLRAEASLPPIGFLNTILYKGKTMLHDIETGNNGAFAAAKGWDACTGLGSPNGQALTAELLQDRRDLDSLQMAVQAEAIAVKLAVKAEAYIAEGNALLAVGNALIEKGKALTGAGHANPQPNAMSAGHHAMIASHHAMIASHHALIGTGHANPQPNAMSAGHHAMIASHHAMIASHHALLGETAPEQPAASVAFANVGADTGAGAGAKR